MACNWSASLLVEALTSSLDIDGNGSLNTSFSSVFIFGESTDSNACYKQLNIYYEQHEVVS